MRPGRPNEAFSVEKRPVLKASTPGGHWTIRLTWLVAFAALLTAAALLLLGSDAALGLALTAAIVFVVALVAYLIRHQRFLSRLTRAEALVAADDLAAARSLVSPLMDRFPGIAAVQRVAGLVLYASGDPLSAASLLERSRAVDATAIVALVASYAALNKAGDARRAAERSPDHPDVRLALAWAELVATGGDRERGAELAHALGNGTPSRAAMAGTLRAIAERARVHRLSRGHRATREWRARRRSCDVHHRHRDGAGHHRRGARASGARSHPRVLGLGPALVRLKRIRVRIDVEAEVVDHRDQAVALVGRRRADPAADDVVG